MKILMVNKFLYPNGGSETYLFKVGAQLQRMGHEVQYFGMEHEGRCVGNAAEVYTQPVDFHGGSKLSKLTMPVKILYSTEAKKAIRQVLEVFHAEVVHLNNINFQLTPSVIEAVKEFDPAIRIVYTAHDSNWVCPNHLLRIPSTGEVCTRCIDGDVSNCTKNRCIHDSRLRSYLGELEARLYRRRGTYRLVDVIICPSDFMNRTLSHHPDLAGRTVTLRNFVDSGMGAASFGENNDVPAGAANPGRSGFGMDIAAEADGESGGGAFSTAGLEGRSDGTAGAAICGESTPAGSGEAGTATADRYVLYFGRFSEEKGIGTLLKACRALPDIPFVFAGKGELEPEVNAEPNVRNVGFQSGADLAEFVRNAAFSVFPSECMENASFTVIESVMGGTPVIASNLGGTPELIAEGETGELFEAGRAEELTNRIRSLWDDGPRLAAYHAGCLRTAAGEGSIVFDDLESYCRKLVEEVYNEPII